MPTRTVQKHPPVAQEDTALMLTIEARLEDFDRIAAAAARLADEEVAGPKPTLLDAAGLALLRTEMHALHTALTQLRIETAILRRERHAVHRAMQTTLRPSRRKPKKPKSH